MAWTPSSPKEALMFRPLTDEEESEFRMWADANKPTDTNPSTGRPWHASLSVLHPVVRDQWFLRGYLDAVSADEVRL